MKNNILIVLIILSIVIISAVAYHSVQEIHYLKTFFPDRSEGFTVEQAKDASIIELVKVSLITIPLLIIILTSLSLLKRK